jgi:glycerophosphoryl diester phosphodiesterase
MAQDFYYIHTKDAGIIKIPGNQVDSVKVENAVEDTVVHFYQANISIYTKNLSGIDSITIVSLPVADLLDLTFKKDGTAEDISPMKNAVTTLESSALFTFFSNSYQRYIARYTNTDPGTTITSGYYKMDYTNNTKFKNALSDGHTLEAYFTLDVASPLPDREIKVFSSHEGGGTGLMIGNNSRGNSIIFLPHISGGYIWANSDVKPVQGKYYHVVGVWNKSEGKAYIYVDGVLKDTRPASGNFSFPSAGCHWFGVGADAGNPAQSGWRGDVAITRIYDKPLTAKEVADLWNAVKDLPVNNDMITNISFLSGISIVHNANYTIQGTGFTAGDQIRLSPLKGSEEDAFVLNGTTTQTSITFALPPELLSGQYRMILVRGDQTQDLGVTSLNIVDFLPDPPKVIAHRGYWDVAGSAQNSIASLAKAQELDIYGSEFDVWMTTDKRLVINHDANLNGSPRFDNSTYDQIKNLKLSNGETLPTLEAYLTQGKKDPNTKLILEIKTHNTVTKNNAVAAAVVAMVRDSSMTEQVEYIAFDLGICRELVRLQPGAKVAYLNGDQSPQALHNQNITGLDYTADVLRKNPTWIDDAHNLGMTVNVWTINGSAEMLEMKKAGVDYITTDNPVTAKTVVLR